MGLFDRKPNVDKLEKRKDVEGLIRALGYEKDWDSKFIRSGAARALGVIRDARAVKPLIQALKDEDVREAAAGALWRIGEPAVKPLIQALKGQDRVIRRQAAAALGEIGDEQAVEPLIQALKDEDRYMRRKAAGALGEIKDARAVEPLIQALKDEDLSVRGEVAEALGKMGDVKAVKSLVAALKDENIDFQKKVVKALRKMGWEPSNESERIAHLVATNNWRELEKIGKPAVKALGGYRKKALAQLSRMSGQEILISRYKAHWLKLGRLVVAAGLVSKNQDIAGYLNKVITARCRGCWTTYSKEALGYLTVIDDFGGRFTLLASTQKSASAHESLFVKKVCPRCGYHYMAIDLNIPEAGA